MVAVDNYQPETCRTTLPSIEAYAHRIGAEFNVVRERRWPKAPPTYEKLQAYDLGRDNDWNIIVDADMLIHETMHDPTEVVPNTMVASWMCYDASAQFPCDKYFYRDGRKLGVSTNFLFVPANCHDALTPFSEGEIGQKMEAMKRPFILDEYCVSTNVARFGLKYCGILSDLKNPPFRHLNATSGHDSHVT